MGGREGGRREGREGARMGEGERERNLEVQRCFERPRADGHIHMTRPETAEAELLEKIRGTNAHSSHGS